MRQVTQKLKSGQMQVIQVPIPSLQKGCLLVRTHYSLISAGTEGSTVKTARKGYIGKIKERPQQVKQVLDVLKSQGPVQTYRAVMKKLDSYSPLGYSCAGEVIAVASDITDYAVGDCVACGGVGSANHAEVVCVPVNLCVKLKPDADLKPAAYNTLGAIALQGVRQADLRLGETCAVIGLGLLGQLTAILLRASGIRVVGIDIDPVMVDIGARHCLDLALNRENHGIEGRIFDFTGGIGCDAVIITAATDSLDPINFAGAISRKKGTVVVVGAVPTGFDREPHFYKKELQVKMSCSYGPGRYDPAYEEKGIDYPPAYVRWTENRNMQAFQELVYNKKIDVSYLTTHTFKLEEAPTAYDMILSKSEPFIGIVIEYDVEKPLKTGRIRVSPEVRSQKSEVVNIGFIGAGSYAQSHLLPNIPKNKEISLKGVMTTGGTTSRSVAERFGFEFCTTSEKDIIENEDINTIFIATRHDSHANYVMKALKAGKHVFVEKPLCLSEVELCQIVELLNSQIGKQESDSASNLQPPTSNQHESDFASNLKPPTFNSPSLTDDTNQRINQSTIQPILMVGYNRRFSPLAQIVKEKFPVGPMAIIYRVNAGSIPADSWVQDVEIGGGRIIGEVCHFVDFLTFMNGSLPVSVYATVMNSPGDFNDVLNVSLSYENGSIGTISYFSNGDKSLPKERVEIFANGVTAVINDFKSLDIHAHGKKKEKKLLSQNKGQKTEVKEFIDAILGGSNELITLDEIFSTSFVTFKIIESISTRKCLSI